MAADGPWRKGPNLAEVESLCRALLDEETAFANWIEQQTEIVTRAYLHREEVGVVSQ
jgi:hypothetical protein